MKEVVKKLEGELEAYLRKTMQPVQTAEEMRQISYAMQTKGYLVSAVMYLDDHDLLSDAAWNHLLVQNSILDYLYALWLGDDRTLVPELAEVVADEIEQDMHALAAKPAESECAA
jgi:hypothetical protein